MYPVQEQSSGTTLHCVVLLSFVEKDCYRTQYLQLSTVHHAHLILDVVDSA